ncbi:hypothetical protein Scel_25700 [Streptomyces cellostaticus]|nr:hypothetical protein Scel_25700 [Streptomyces cellostaticus]
MRLISFLTAMVGAVALLLGSAPAASADADNCVLTIAIPLCLGGGGV